MIDIHSHIIPNVDDGSKSLESSIKLIRDEIEEGVTDIICTPHFRKKMFETSLEEIKKQFNLLNEEVKKQALPINLYLGQEIYLRRTDSLNEYIKDKSIITLNNTSYYLLEFSYVNDIDLSEVCYVNKINGYKAIIAHIERYEYIDVEQAYDIKSTGSLIQVNALSIIGKYGSKIKHKVMKLIKNDLVDFVASDIHETRENGMKKAFDIVNKKFGNDIANKLFYQNATMLVNTIEK